jgi:Bifunctional DNA primase/polymerase, N-terminal/Primase C terminal 1 (PriCT-1)
MHEDAGAGRVIAFAQLQEVYAAHRVATYPLSENKMPAIRGYERIGVHGSAQLALKFAEVTAAGFLAGSRNRITVADIDTDDEKLVEEIENRYGATPLLVRTPSGGWHAYYRHAGEARRIRPLPDVDILGGGNVVAALSVVPKGRYEIVRGSLEELDRLPTMRQDNRPPARIPEGKRNNALFDYCKSVVSHCDDFDQLLDAALTWADARLAVPLPESEIAKTCRSVWDYRGGRKRIMNHIIDSKIYKALAADTDALALFAYLSAENGTDAEFMVADGLGEAMGWPRRFVPAARKTLLDLGIIRCVRRHAVGQPALYRWIIDQ